MPTSGDRAAAGARTRPPAAWPTCASTTRSARRTRVRVGVPGTTSSRERCGLTKRGGEPGRGRGRPAHPAPLPMPTAARERERRGREEEVRLGWDCGTAAEQTEIDDTATERESKPVRRDGRAPGRTRPESLPAVPRSGRWESARIGVCGASCGFPCRAERWVQLFCSMQNAKKKRRALSRAGGWLLGDYAGSTR